MQTQRAAVLEAVEETARAMHTPFARGVSLHVSCSSNNQSIPSNTRQLARVRGATTARSSETLACTPPAAWRRTAASERTPPARPPAPARCPTRMQQPPPGRSPGPAPLLAQQHGWRRRTQPWRQPPTGSGPLRQHAAEPPRADGQPAQYARYGYSKSPHGHHLDAPIVHAPLSIYYNTPRNDGYSVSCRDKAQNWSGML
jgi:hypothetical protein